MLRIFGVFSQSLVVPVAGGARWLPYHPTRRERQALGAACMSNTTLHEAQASGELIAQLDDLNYALDGLGEEKDIRILRSNTLSLAELCSVKEQRSLFASHVRYSRILMESD